MSQSPEASATTLSFDQFKQQVLDDYRIATVSRECSLLGRREVLTGKAKFGIFGDGKEIPQLAWARAFKNGDFRSGYYRDQTFMMAIDELTPQQFFAGLYAHTDIEIEPMSAGRQMGGHFATHSLNEDGSWKVLKDKKNSSADISPTAGQMPRLLGLAQASQIYRHVDAIEEDNKFSRKGNEVAWGTIGNASTSEGLFWETFNAAGVLQVPMVISVWDDEYGISVHARHQTTKENISEILKGFQRDENSNGFEIRTVNGWDYAELINVYAEAGTIAREQHVPVLIHVRELTQPQGHSTSGSHERYKSKERLEWEQQYDCLAQMRQWMLDNGIADEDTLKGMEKDAKKAARTGKQQAWAAFVQPMKQERDELIQILDQVIAQADDTTFIAPAVNKLRDTDEPIRKDILTTARMVSRRLAGDQAPALSTLRTWINTYHDKVQDSYSSHLFSNSTQRATEVAAVAPTYDGDSAEVDARVILRDNFDRIFGSMPETLVFGEDSGEIGDVNQGLEGLQEKYGKYRVADAGIREATILGQGIGMAMRGLRPIAEIQYLDYLLYCLQIMSDDLATLQYRTRGRQKAPVIIRTRGHRLEGIWHSGSPMGGIINLVRGVHVLVPRNMTQAAGFYNTLLDSDEPGLIIENLNGYRLKEKMPNNLGDIRTPIGVVEIVREGSDMTVVSYGSTLRLVQDAAQLLAQAGIEIEIVDAQSLLPFDLNHDTVKSVAKTNRLLVVDEDVPGGASAYLLQHVIDTQGGYKHLDTEPACLAARDHRPAYGTDGDYFSKPSVDDIYDKVYAMMHEARPADYPSYAE